LTTCRKWPVVVDVVGPGGGLLPGTDQDGRPGVKVMHR